MRLTWLFLILASAFCDELRAAEPADAGPIQNLRMLPYTPREEYETKRGTPVAAAVYGDRMVYWNDDGAGQFVVIFPAGAKKGAGKIAIELQQNNKSITTRQLDLPKDDDHAKAVFLLDTDSLPVGKYSIKATLVDAAGKNVADARPAEFTRMQKAHPKIPIPPEGVPLLLVNDEVPSMGRWPVTTGIPMPQGTLTDPSKLTLEENGKAIAAQWTVRSRWGPSPNATVKWLGLDFIGSADSGKPREYRIRIGTVVSPASRMKTSQTPERITIENGLLRFHVDRKRFTGIDAAWVDANGDGKFAEDEQIIAAPPQPKTGEKRLPPGVAGPYVRDARGLFYEALNDEQVQVSVEHEGPVRTTVVAKGWYTNPSVSKEAGGPRLCQFITRLTAYVGDPHIRINHRTIITYDTRLNRISDAGFTMPLVQTASEKWMAGLDGKTFEGPLPAAGTTVYVHQEKHDQVRLMEGTTNKGGGKRSDGWLALSGANLSISAMLRDVWQKYPKELEAEKGALTFHFWPRHGRRVFSAEAELERRNIYKIWYAHQGTMLDLQLPSAYFDRLDEWHETERWDPENTRFHGLMGNGQGLAIGNELAIRLGATAKAEEHASAARLFQSRPHALASPEWNCRTEALGHLAPRDDKKWPEIERVLNESYPKSMLGTTEHLGTYGMWIYGNTCNGWHGEQPQLHRVWQNSHYQHVGMNWLLYFRSGSSPLLRWARAATDNYMDVGTVNYHDPERPMMGRTTGSMYHAKGFMPWGSRQYGMDRNDTDLGNWGHWVDPTALLLRYLIEGDERAGEMHRAWYATLGEGSRLAFSGREGSNTIGQILTAYTVTWDPQAIVFIHTLYEAMMATPFEKYAHAPGFPMWHKTWAEQHYDLMRDERLVKATEAYIKAGFDHAAPNAFAFRATGNKEYVTGVLAGLLMQMRLVYHNSEDPLDGFGFYSAAVGTPVLLQAPYLLDAVNQAQIASTEQSLKPYYATAGSHSYKQTRLVEIALKVLALDPDDRAFKVKIEGSTGHANDVVVLSPSGKLIHHFDVDKVRSTKGELTGEGIEYLDVPADGEKGIYTVLLFGHMPLFASPLTNLPHEIAMLDKSGETYRGYRLGQHYLAAAPGSTGTLTVRALGYGPMPGYAYVRLSDPSGTTIVEQSLLNIGMRKEISADLKSLDRITVWPIYTAADSGPGIIWSGKEPLFLSTDPTHFAPILEELTTSGGIKLPK